MAFRPLSLLCAITASLGFASAALAQDTDLTGKLSVELNSADTSEAEGAPACTLSFFAINGLSSDVDGLVLETVIFDTDGKVDRLTLFDLGALPMARPRVRQFAVPGVGCDGIGQILINGVQSCSGTELTPGLCTDALLPSSRVEIKILG